MTSALATAYNTDQHRTRGMGMKEAAQKTGFTSDRALYKFLREHAGFQGTTPPRELVRQGYFFVRQSQYFRGPVAHPTAVTKATATGLTYIAELKNNQEKQG
ncbi:MAG: hypothetical protein OIF57_08625 [Marinobacterium sp.]|nr:hypothetical protein [Marinobacterium sp.]